MDAAQIEADLMAKREQDVIVYREIVHRDAKISRRSTTSTTSPRRSTTSRPSRACA